MIKHNINDVICRLDDENSDMLMEISVKKIKSNEAIELKKDGKEVAILLLNGSGTFEWDGKVRKVTRKSLIYERPTCLHVSNGTSVIVQAEEDIEILIQATENLAKFPSKLYSSDDIKEDIFGDGVLQETTRRRVRTIFDYNNASYSNMVMGEVITYPGRWSSYIPHHHPQPEVYYYRFDREQGFGVSMIGNEAYIVKDKSVSFIKGGLTHPQVAAPGYPMYYCWMIRHLENNPWTERIDDEKHTWMKDENVQIWGE